MTMHWYKKNIGDYRRRTSGLNLLGHGIYQQLIDNYYLNGGPLTLDFEDICFDLGASTDAERDMTMRILNKYFEKTDEGWLHHHCEEVLEPYRARCLINKENATGKRKTTKANKNQTKSDSLANGIRKDSDTCLTNNHKPVTNNKNNTSSEIDDAVDYFWEHGTRPANEPKKHALKRVGKQPATTKLKNKLKALPKETKPMDFVKHLIADIQKRFEEGVFGIDNLHPVTYINQERWNDEHYGASGNRESTARSTASEQVSRSIIEAIEAGNQQCSDDLAGDGRVVSEQLD